MSFTHCLQTLDRASEYMGYRSNEIKDCQSEAVSQVPVIFNVLFKISKNKLHQHRNYLNVAIFKKILTGQFFDGRLLTGNSSLVRKFIAEQFTANQFIGCNRYIYYTTILRRKNPLQTFSRQTNPHRMITRPTIAQWKVPRPRMINCPARNRLAKNCMARN